MRSSPEPTAPRTVATLVEWRAPQMTPPEAAEVADFSLRMLRRVPGFVSARFFGEFEEGVHYYLLVWESREALDAYLASEPMMRVREVAARFVEGKPERRIMADYTPEETGEP